MTGKATQTQAKGAESEATPATRLATAALLIARY